MQPVRVRDATHHFQPPENWHPEKHGECLDLYVRWQRGLADTIQWVSAWKPDRYELDLLNKGGAIEIGVCAQNQPAIFAQAVERPEVEVSRPSTITINEEAHGHDDFGPATP